MTIVAAISGVGHIGGMGIRGMAVIACKMTYLTITWAANRMI